MVRIASLKFLSQTFVITMALLAAPAFAETHAAPPVAEPAHAAPATPPVAAPITPAPEAPKVDAPKVEAPHAETPKAEHAKTETAKPEEKQTGKMRDRWKKMTPEQREEMRKKAENRLGERYDRLKTAQQENIKGILANINKLDKEERSILMARIRQQAHKDRVQRKAMKEMEKAKSEAPAADPNATAKH
ncbi:MAG: hypothetical protein EB059_07810 [Alphaproteobacteria bacterium]|nr:hypothetical protein [Alphaproteobacteria bacterium]